MKIFRKLILFAAVSTTLLFVACKDEDDNGNAIFQETCTDGILNGDETEIDCGGPNCKPCGVAALDFTGTYIQEDQMGRPQINSIFGTEGFRDEFNITIPSEMQANFQERFQFKLTDSTGLNPNYTTNVLGLNAEEFTTLLSKDVLWLAQTGVTTYSNGSEILTGRALGDDVMDTTLLWIFGGPDGSENPGLTNDGVPSNDAPYTTSFPYLVGPF
jgi:hypothetical protein